MKVNWNFLGDGGGGVHLKPSAGVVWIFSGPAHFQVLLKFLLPPSRLSIVHFGALLLLQDHRFAS